MGTARSAVAKYRQEYEGIIASRKRCLDAYRQHLDHLEKGANSLLSAYREANRRARTTPPPAHFSQPWQAERTDNLVFQVMDGRRLDVAAKRVGEVLDTRTVEVHQAYDRAVEAFKKIEQLSGEDLADGSAQKIVDAA